MSSRRSAWRSAVTSSRSVIGAAAYFPRVRPLLGSRAGTPGRERPAGRSAAPVAARGARRSAARARARLGAQAGDRGGPAPSMILFGPPGTGKTTIARIVAERTGAVFEEISAVSARVDDVRAVIARARDRLGGNDVRTILFIDEIHRFNKAQQDSVLHAVEDGLVTLIGATTENPYFEVNSALLSRCTVIELTRALGRRARRDPRARRGGARRGSAASCRRASREARRWRRAGGAADPRARRGDGATRRAAH